MTPDWITEAEKAIAAATPDNALEAARKRHARVLERLKTCTPKQVAERFGLTRQSVYRIRNEAKK